ncbi:hypothetical protein [Nonomuraea zeae]|nr:hypothetical protein [Nonomuraea zeae]
MSPETLKDFLDPRDPIDSLLQAIRAYEAAPGRASDSPAESGQVPQAGKSPWRRVRYFFAEPSVRTAVCATLDRAAQRIAPLIQATGEISETQARVIANALAFGYFAALEQWYLDGGNRPIADYVEEGMRPLRGIWSAPRPSSEHS